MVEIDNPTNYPDPAYIDYCEEPFANAYIYVPSDYVGTVMDMCQDNVAFLKIWNISHRPCWYSLWNALNEIIYDFFDDLKSRTRGYASFDYELTDYRKSDLCKVDVLLNGDIIDALSFIIHRDKAYARARRIAEQLKKHIPRHLFEIPIQVAIGGKVIGEKL